MRRLLGLVLVIALLGAAGQPAEVRAKKEPSPAQQAFELYDKAERFVERDRACRTFRPERKPTFTDAAPSRRLLSTLGILRRPEAPDERDLFKARVPFGAGIYRHHIRIARSVSGREFLIYAARDVGSLRPRPERCRVALRRRVERLARNRPRAVRRLARRIISDLMRAERRSEAAPPPEGVFLFNRSIDGTAESGGGGAGAADIRRSGMFQSSSVGRNPSRARVDGLLPDGVATVTAVYGRRGNAFGPNKRRTYARGVKLTAPVQDNVVSFAVPRRPEDALFPARWVWRSADGRVVRVVKSPPG